MIKRLIQGFFLPKLNRFFLLRILGLILVTVVVFTQVLIPLRIEGQSMEPTYKNGFNLCWRGRYLFSSPQRGEVVVIRFAGNRVLLLKRIVALAGDTVAFKNGILLVNGQPVQEPYVRYRRDDWNLEPRTVDPGKVYVVGDNRGVDMGRHHFGQVDQMRIVGGLLW
ncbi:MAG: signal peptidase I [Desulfobulbus sp.]|nr:signal peptidase I [Desulfobulbus sp.]